MITNNISTLKIHKMTQAQYERELAAGNIDENALYLTPDEDRDLSLYLTKDEATQEYESQIAAQEKLGEAKEYAETVILAVTKEMGESKADKEHSHDEMYYTEDEVNELLANKKGNDFIVTVSGDETSGYIADKTYAEITQAYNDGRTCVLTDADGSILTLTSLSKLYASFALLGNYSSRVVLVTAANKIIIKTTQFVKDEENPSLVTSNKTIVGAINELDAGLDNHKHSIEDIEGFNSSVDSAILYTEQELTDEQRAQARANIDKYRWKTCRDRWGIYTYDINAESINYELAQTVPNTSGNGSLSALEDIVSYGSALGFCLNAPGINIAKDMVSNFEALKSANAIKSSNGMHIFLGETNNTLKASLQIVTQTNAEYTHAILLDNSQANYNTYIYYNKNENVITGWKSSYKSVSKTMNTAGMAADAKAVGDALATKITGPVTATVGQTIVVKSVDENGKPTEWEAVDVDIDGYATEEWVGQNYQPKGDYLTQANLQTATNNALAQAKSSGEFDGENGLPGAAGKDGVSPTVTVSKSGKVTTVKITDVNGTKTATINDGADGKTPVKGTDYFDGKDGVSATHSWNGTTLTVTSASGTSSANLKGEKGDKGTSVTVKSVTTSTADGGSNVVTFSDGKTVTIKNGSKGSTGGTGAAGADGYSIFYSSSDGASSKVYDVDIQKSNIVTQGRTIQVGDLILASKLYIVKAVADSYCSCDFLAEIKSTENAPDYVIDEAERLATLVQSRQNENTITFMLGSDVHLSLTNTNANQMLASVTHAGMAMDILKKTVHIDFSAILGDLIWDGDTNAVGVQTMRKVHELLGEHDFWTEGNHDCQYGGETITRQQKFANIGKWNIGAVYDSENRLGGYCYRDYEEYKLRVICLNTCEDTTGDFTISTQQINWLISALADMPEEYFAIILSHHPLNWLGNTTTIVNTIKNYKGKILATFHGHCHNYLATEIGDTGIYRIAVPNINFYRANEYGENGATEYGGVENGEDVTYNKTANTAEDTSFCVFTLDMASGMMYADHYGAGYDREIQLSLGGDSYTNLVPTALDYDLDGIYNGIGYRNGYYSSTTAPYTTSTSDGSVVTGLFPFGVEWKGANSDGKVTPPTIYIKGVTFDTANSHNRIGFFRDDTKAVCNTLKVSELSKYYTIETLGTQYYKLIPVMNTSTGKNAIFEAMSANTFNSAVTHIAISANGDGANMIVTYNQEITD